MANDLHIEPLVGGLRQIAEKIISWPMLTGFVSPRAAARRYTGRDKRHKNRTKVVVKRRLS